MNDSSHIQLVCIARKENAAATIESFLRDRGQPVRMKWLQAEEGLEESLAKIPADLIFINSSDEKRMEFALHCCRKVGPHIPILILAEELNADSADMALQKRARDAVSTERMEHLLAVVLRELAASKLESYLREAKQELTSLRARVQSLVSASRLAIARIQEGILVEVSEDFIRLFGHESEDSLIGHPFLQVIQAKEQARIKKLLSKCSQGKSDTEDLDTTGQADDGRAFPLRVSLTMVETEEGAAVEVQARRMDQRRSDQLPASKEATTEAETEIAIDEPAVKIDEKTLNEIEDALAKDRCRLESRALIALDGQECNLIECQLRLEKEDGSWIDASEDSRSNNQVLQDADMKLLGSAAEFLALNAAKGEQTTLIAPLHPASLGQINTLRAWVDRDLKKLLADNQQLVLSFPEKAFANQIDAAARLVQDLRALGLKFAIDQGRGSGVTVKMMESLHPEYLCLDKSSTQLLISQGTEHAQLSKAIAHSHEHGMKIVAYPLQDAHSMAMLWQRGVNLIRGSGDFQVTGN